jgi:sarcosine oxidase
MTAQHYDVIVVGLGAMGSAALYQSAKRGAKVLGIDRFAPPHTMGSSHGDTRITRQAIGEGEMYMPFIKRSNEIWHELEAETGRNLYLKTGGLIIAPQNGAAHWHADGDFVERTANIATAHNIEHEVLNADEVQRRHPNLILQSNDYAYYEPASGVLRPELCIQTQLEQAVKYGATIHTNEQVMDYATTSDGVTITSDKATYTADKVVLSAGAWMLDLIDPKYRKDLEVYRQVIYWFEAEDIEVFTEENFRHGSS